MGTSVDFIVVASAECLANSRYVGDVLADELERTRKEGKEGLLQSVWKHV